MAKKTTLTRDQAAELEEMLGDAVTYRRFGDPKRDIRDLLRQVGCPKDVTAALLMRVESIMEDVKYLEQEVTRGNAESVVDGFKALDAYLAKRFNVTMPRKNQAYRWMVG